MICEVHNRFFPQRKCPLCEKERKELKWAIALVEFENSKPIVIWDGNHV